MMYRIIIILFIGVFFCAQTFSQEQIYETLKELAYLNVSISYENVTHRIYLDTLGSTEVYSIPNTSLVEKIKTWTEREIEELIPLTLKEDKNIHESILIAIIISQGRDWNKLYEMAQNKEIQGNIYEAEVYYLSSYYHYRRYTFALGGKERIIKYKEGIEWAIKKYDIDVPKKKEGKDEEKKGLDFENADEILYKKINQLKTKMTNPAQIAFVDNIKSVIEKKFPID